MDAARAPAHLARQAHLWRPQTTLRRLFDRTALPDKRRSEMNILDPAIEKYLHELQPSRDAVLIEMEKRGATERFPIIGPLVGRLCQQLALGIGARDIFEMGSGFGYSTYWFAQAVGSNGRVVHTDGDEKKSADAKNYLER